MNAAPFDPALALRVLLRHGVRFVMIGGLATRLRGSPTVTNDLDICYARDNENLESLATALSELDAHLRGGPRSVPFKLEAKTLSAGDHFTFETRAGNLDILGSPSGTGGYEELRRLADVISIEGMAIPVASLDDLIAMKRAADRPKDRIEVEILSALRDEVEKGKQRKRQRKKN
jgi:hypothetical protein